MAAVADYFGHNGDNCSTTTRTNRFEARRSTNFQPTLAPVQLHPQTTETVLPQQNTRKYLYNSPCNCPPPAYDVSTFKSVVFNYPPYPPTLHP